MIGNYFIMLVMLLEFCALVAYIAQRKWIEVVYWLGVLFINGAILGRQFLK